jgi:hypothetical protein
MEPQATVNDNDIEIEEVVVEQKPASTAINGHDDREEGAAENKENQNGDEEDEVAEENDEEEDVLTAEEERALINLKKLDDYIAKLSKEIKVMQQQEISIDEMEKADSAFIKMCCYKKSMNEAYDKFVIIVNKYPHLVEWSDLKKAKTPQQQQQQRLNSIKDVRFRTKINFKSSYDERINMAVSEMLNKTKQFPCFGDIADLIGKLNKELKLNYDEAKLETTSKEIFKMVGKLLRERRVNVLRRNLAEIAATAQNEDDDHNQRNNSTSNAPASVLTDAAAASAEESFEELVKNDPAEKDPELRQKIEKNKSEFNQKLSELEKEFFRKQETAAAAAAEAGTENGDEEDDEEDEDDDEDDENTDGTTEGDDEQEIQEDDDEDEQHQDEIKEEEKEKEAKEEIIQLNNHTEVKEGVESLENKSSDNQTINKNKRSLEVAEIDREELSCSPINFSDLNPEKSGKEAKRLKACTGNANSPIELD